MPVFVPDLEQTLNGQTQELQGFMVLGEAAWNLGLRMALYERAYISMGVNTGPMGLCWLNARTHYATLKMAPADVPQTAPAFYRELGFEPGRSLPFAKPTQELVWEDDTHRGYSTRLHPHRRAPREQGARCLTAVARKPLDNAPSTS